MSEAVVVALEAVEVEDHEEGRDGPLLGQAGLEVEDQFAPVEQTGEGVGDRLVVRQLEQLLVLPERRREAHEDDEQGRGREDHREQVQVPEVVADEDPYSDECRDRGHGQEGPSFDREPAPVPLVDPGRAADEQHRDRPEDVDERSGLVGPCGDLEQVDAVSDRGREHAKPEHEPEPSGPPGREREDAEDR